jgi:protein-S-isoprenylcysteine O-methyltransferase Ste14/phosphohistidine phosphatase SixA
LPIGVLLSVTDPYYLSILLNTRQEIFSARCARFRLCLAPSALVFAFLVLYDPRRTPLFKSANAAQDHVMLQKLLESQGASPRRWRILLALLLAPFAINAFFSSGWMLRAFGPWGEEFWDFFCLAIAFAGLGVRATIAGYGQGTDLERKDSAGKMYVTGFYSIVRHPIYLANFLILFSGILLFKSAPFTALAAVGACVYYERLILAKERSLLEMHGDAFRAWAESTPTILARFSAWRTPVEKFDLRTAVRREAVTFALIGLMFFTIESLEAVLVEKRNFITWTADEAHWAILFAVSLAIVWTQLSRVWSILLFALYSIALGGTHVGRSVLAMPERREEALQALSAGGHVLLLRHGSTIGSDQELVRPADCTTQRNLSEKGREQARALGKLLRERGVKLAKVISSQYCRCQETAAMIGATLVETSPDLNEKQMHVTLVERIVGNFEKDEAILRPVRAIIAEWKGSGTLLLVSHAPNIAGLTFEDMDTAEGLVLEPAPGAPLGFTVVGRIKRHAN